MDPLSLIFAKADLALSLILGYLENPEILFICAAVAAILALALIHQDY